MTDRINMNDSKMPLVSVVVPNYNYARFLDQRMASILNQTYENIEVIVLDDCSTDDSLAVLEKYKDDARVKVIVNAENSGSPSKQWAKGIKMASGDIVWIAEADDYCTENMLSTLVKAFLHRENSSYAFCRLEYVDEMGEVIFVPRHECKPVQYYSGRQYIRRYLSMGCDVENASCAIFRRSYAMNIVDNGLWLEMPTANDYMFWVEMAFYGDVAIFAEKMDKFRKHSGELTGKHDRDGSNFKEEKYVLDYIMSHMKFSLWRKYLVYANRRRKIMGMEFNDEGIREELRSIWKSGISTPYIDRKVTNINYKWHVFRKS